MVTRFPHSYRYQTNFKPDVFKRNKFLFLSNQKYVSHFQLGIDYIILVTKFYICMKMFDVVTLSIVSIKEYLIWYLNLCI